MVSLEGNARIDLDWRTDQYSVTIGGVSASYTVAKGDSLASAALGLASSAAEVAERVKTLANHQCLYKSFDSPGQIIRGRPFYELVAREADGD